MCYCDRREFKLTDIFFIFLLMLTGRGIIFICSARKGKKISCTDFLTVYTVFWRKCPGKWLHLLGNLWAFHIWEENPFLRVQKKTFLYVTYFECVLGALRNSFLFNNYMICIYFILKKRKRSSLKMINVLSTLPSRNHNYPVFVGVWVLKVRTYRSYGNTQRACWFKYCCCRFL